MEQAAANQPDAGRNGDRPAQTPSVGLDLLATDPVGSGRLGPGHHGHRSPPS